ncbi:hypothetical protein C162_25480 [Paenibacillus sp. FSL R7-269]|nr:hypothetical protein C162_25480 [Paenibacillus sp. FSL R7-269]
MQWLFGQPLCFGFGRKPGCTLAVREVKGIHPLESAESPLIGQMRSISAPESAESPPIGQMRSTSAPESAENPPIGQMRSTSAPESAESPPTKQSGTRAVLFQQCSPLEKYCSFLCLAQRIRQPADSI